MSKILIKNADYVVVADQERTRSRQEGQIPEGTARILEHGNLLIKDNRILAVDSSLRKIAQSFPDEIPQKEDEIEKAVESVVDGRGKIVLPGLVNTHHHLYQTFQRNIPGLQDVGLFQWLLGLYEIWRELDEEIVYKSALVGLGELLLTGCTTTTDHFYVFPRGKSGRLIDEEIKAARKLGIRFAPTRGSMSLGRSRGGLPPDDIVQTEEEILSDSLRVIQKHHDPSPLSMLKIGLAPCSPFSVSESLMRETIKMARAHGVRCHTHLAETKDEERFCVEKLQMRPFEYMEKVEWVGEDVWYAHAIHLNDREIQKMAETGTGIAHCPTSNLRLGSGIAPIPKMLDAGIPVGLAVDGSASNDSSNMLAEVRMGMLVHRVGTGVDAMPATTILEVATRGGARILGWETLGEIAPGKAADVVLFDLKKIGYAGALHDPLAALFFCGDSQIADTAIVNGKIVVKNGKLLNIDERKLVEEANSLARKMVERAKKKLSETGRSVRNR